MAQKQHLTRQNKDAKHDIASLLGFFECELVKEPDSLNWANIGNLKHIRKNFIETLSFMSGIAENAVNETLEESRM